jgi:simple sugar transport system ATP-binding protein
MDPAVRPREILRLRRVSKSYGGVRALQGVDLVVREGEVHCLAGENGSGKSTLIKLIAGVETPDEGEIEIGGRRIRRLRPIDAIRAGVGVIYQDFSLFPDLTVAENIALAAELTAGRLWIDWRRVRETARRGLERIGARLDLDARAGEIPVAGKAMVAIARALVRDARLIIMDEPTAALTRPEVRKLFAAIEGLRREGISTLFVSHRLDEVLEISQRTLILRNGRTVVDADTRALDRTKLTYYMTGREVPGAPAGPPPRRTEETPLLGVEGLSAGRSLRDASFDLRSGEVLGVTGLLGSGRDELALAISGVIPVRSGTIAIDGRPVHLRSIRDAMGLGIGLVPEDRLREGLFLDQSIGRNIAAGSLDRLAGRWGILDRPRMAAEIADWIHRLGIRASSPEAAARTLSGGNAQRIVLARWLARRPRIMVLSGPTVGVHVGSKEEIHEILRGMARLGMGVVLISDDIPELIAVCGRVLVLRDGRIGERLEGKDLREEVLAADPSFPVKGKERYPGEE